MKRTLDQWLDIRFGVDRVALDAANRKCEKALAQGREYLRRHAQARDAALQTRAALFLRRLRARADA